MLIEESLSRENESHGVARDTVEHEFSTAPKGSLTKEMALSYVRSDDSYLCYANCWRLAEDDVSKFRDEEVILEALKFNKKIYNFIAFGPFPSEQKSFKGILPDIKDHEQSQAVMMAMLDINPEYIKYIDQKRLDDDIIKYAFYSIDDKYERSNDKGQAMDDLNEYLMKCERANLMIDEEEFYKMRMWDNIDKQNKKNESYANGTPVLKGDFFSRNKNFNTNELKHN